MDFSNRNVQSQAAAPGAQPAAGGTAKKHRQSDNGKWGRIGVAAAFLAIAILLAGVITLAIVGNNDKVDTEDKYVESSKLQAVFLNTGQVYFGNIETLNSKYLVVNHIYYLQTASSDGAAAATTANSNTSVSLVKLGCELHQPNDQMVINRDQVTFWENLSDGGQVAKAVAAFEKANPQGQKCADQSSAASSNSSNSVQNAGTANTGTTNKQ